MKYKENTETIPECVEESVKEESKSSDPKINKILIERISVDMKLIERSFESIKTALQYLSYINEDND